MSHIFNFQDLHKYDLYHIRYGRGAVIAAIKKNSADNNISDKYIAELFSSKEQEHFNFTKQHLDPIEEITEENGMVKIKIRFERTSNTHRDYKPVNALINRILPANQVTLELIDSSSIA